MQILISAEELNQLDAIANDNGWTRAQTIRALIRQAYRAGLAGGSTTTCPQGGHWPLVTADEKRPSTADKQ